jgi:hypothetical protein
MTMSQETTTSPLTVVLVRGTHRTTSGGDGHNLPQEAPERFVQAVMDVDRFSS